MAERPGDKPERKPGSLLGTAIKTGAKALSTAGSALRSQPVRRVRAGIRTVAGGLVGVTRFVRFNSLRGVLAGEVVLSERDVNRWFARVEPPEGVSSMALRCNPSRLVLVMTFERRLLGVPLGSTQVELPFAIEAIEIDASGGVIELRLDRAAVPEARGLLKPLVIRLLSRAAADLLDDRNPLERLDSASRVIRREGERLIVDVGAFPPFVELMERELRLIGGRSLFPFRALAVHGARIEEGRLIVLMRLDPEQLAGRTTPIEIEEELDRMASAPETTSVEVAIVASTADDDLDDPFFDEPLAEAFDDEPDQEN